ncbi:restriction endonuclease subunit S [Streptomyces griseorubiginosus]|uniref:restriction endonuclease subunit S n=1 Tax=Streptomyces griseorubiginosus TaxID=67304 RepID=UPI002E7FF2B5|nr:restriction endonuclease subunit S [Streptomyces griseorubiginosus]WUB46352.1 restriction endonuclease subunit S [Streptomyces griseorubiginosus]WUB54873.1 restriction endonuclease subunit S [Streptomyces griseorubiginosus]
MTSLVITETASVTLEEISAFITKGSTPTTHGFSWESTGVPFLRSECVSEHGLDMRQSMFISPAANHVLRRSQVADGDILMTITGYVGRVIRLSGVGEGNINQHIARVRIKDRRFDPGYVYHYLSQPSIREYYESIITGQAYPQISLVQVRETKIPDLPLKEQQAISASLDSADEFIAKLEKMFAKKQAIKQGMIQQLLTGRIRMPGFVEPWRTARLGELLKRPPRYGINAPAIPYSIDAHTYIRITDIDDAGNFTPRPKVSVRQPSSADYLLREGELVFARTGASVGKSYLYNPDDGELVYAGFLINLAPDPQALDPAYLALVTQTAQYWDWVARTSVRSGQPGINGREYAQLQIMLPGIREQRAIASTVNDISREMRVLSKRLVKARAVKQGLMQQLLTGRTRLPAMEGAA